MKEVYRQIGIAFAAAIIIELIIIGVASLELHRL